MGVILIAKVQVCHKFAEKIGIVHFANQPHNLFDLVIHALLLFLVSESQPPHASSGLCELHQD